MRVVGDFEEESKSSCCEVIKSYARAQAWVEDRFFLFAAQCPVPGSSTWSLLGSRLGTDCWSRLMSGRRLACGSGVWRALIGCMQAVGEQRRRDGEALNRSSDPLQVPTKLLLATAR